MLLRDLRKVYVSTYEEIEDHGETTKKWKFKKQMLTVKEVNSTPVKELNKIKVKKLSIKKDDGVAWLNLQQDVNELDRKSTGEVDYSIYKGRTTIDYPIEKGDGISFKDISKVENFVPEYRILDKNKIGNTFVYRLEKMQ